MIATLLLLPFVTGVLGLLTLRSPAGAALLSRVSVVASLALTVITLSQVLQNGPQVLQWGRWIAPFGITFVADALSLIVLAGIYTGALMASFSSGALLDSARLRTGYFIFFQFMLFGATGALLTGDFFNLYVWFEVLLMSAFGLMSLGAEPSQLRGTARYFMLNLLGSMIFLVGAGLMYGFFGTLNMADLYLRLRESGGANLSWTPLVSSFLLVAYALKAGAFPFYGWLPSSYHCPPIVVTALFSAVLTKVGVYVLIRTFGMVIPISPELLMTIAVLSMLFGSLGAMVQPTITRILSFGIIAQTGYMILGLALQSSLALAAGLFHLIHNIVVKTNLLLVTARIQKAMGTDDLRYLGGLSKSAGLLTFIFLASSLSLIGLPPFSGFYSKLALIRSSVVQENWISLSAVLLTGLLTLMAFVKIWGSAFWRVEPKAIKAPSFRFDFHTDIILVIATAVTVSAYIYGEPLLNLLLNVAHQIQNPEAYVRAVMGRGLQ